MTDWRDQLRESADNAMPGKWSVDERAMSIWTDHLRGGKVFDVRGWGHLTGGGAMNLPHDKAEAIQRATANLVCLLHDHLPEILAALRPIDQPDGLVEAVARALCKAARENPDEMIQAGNPIGEPADYPQWMLWLPEARAALSIIPSARARIVAWLRGKALECREERRGYDPLSHGHVLYSDLDRRLNSYADAIEAGTHETPT